MRIPSLLTVVALLATTVFAVEIVGTSALVIFTLPACGDSSSLFSASAPEHEESYELPVEDPVLAVTASFPESNPFGRASPLCPRPFFPTLLRTWHGTQTLLTGNPINCY
jgi:hypothetical protein